MELTSEPQPEIIAHLSADTPRLMRFVVKADQDPTSLVPQLRSALAELDAEIPMMRVRTMSMVAVDALAADRYLMILLGVFAAVALVLFGEHDLTQAATTINVSPAAVAVHLRDALWKLRAVPGASDSAPERS